MFPTLGVGTCWFWNVSMPLRYQNRYEKHAPWSHTLFTAFQRFKFHDYRRHALLALLSPRHGNVHSIHTMKPFENCLCVTLRMSQLESVEQCVNKLLSLEMCAKISLKKKFGNQFTSTVGSSKFSFYPSFRVRMKSTWNTLLSISRSCRLSISRCCICEYTVSVTCLNKELKIRQQLQISPTCN